MVFTYSRKNHFIYTLDQIQGKNSVSISEEHLNKIREDCGNNITEINIED